VTLRTSRPDPLQAHQLLILYSGISASTHTSFWRCATGATGTFHENDYLHCGGGGRRLPSFRLLLPWRTSSWRRRYWRPWRRRDRRSRFWRVDDRHARRSRDRGGFRCGARRGDSAVLPTASSPTACLCSVGLGQLRPSGMCRLLLTADNPDT
jgi:hypothetical protein